MRNDSSFWHQNFVFDNTQGELCSQGEFLLDDVARCWNSGAGVRFLLSPCKEGENTPIALSDNHILVVIGLDIGQPAVAEVAGNFEDVVSDLLPTFGQDLELFVVFGQRNLKRVLYNQKFIAIIDWIVYS